MAPKSTKKWALIAKSLKTFRSVAGSSIKDLVRFRTNGKNIVCQFEKSVLSIESIKLEQMCDFYFKKECAKTHSWCMKACFCQFFQLTFHKIFLSENRKESNEALQLFFRLLSPSSRIELEHLFRFLYSVSSK